MAYGFVQGWIYVDKIDYLAPKVPSLHINKEKIIEYLTRNPLPKNESFENKYDLITCLTETRGPLILDPYDEEEFMNYMETLIQECSTSKNKTSRK